VAGEPAGTNVDMGDTVDCGGLGKRDPDVVIEVVGEPRPDTESSSLTVSKSGRNKFP